MERGEDLVQGGTVLLRVNTYMVWSGMSPASTFLASFLAFFSASISLLLQLIIVTPTNRGVGTNAANLPLSNLVCILGITSRHSHPLHAVCHFAMYFKWHSEGNAPETSCLFNNFLLLFLCFPCDRRSISVYVAHFFSSPLGR